MAAAKKLWPLSKVDGAHWDAEDLFGRMCIVAHAAFLSAGFLPCDAPETTTPCSYLSRRYTLPQLAHSEGADAAVLCVSRRGRRRGGCGRGRFQVDAYVDCNGLQQNASRERLPLAALAPVLSGGMDDAARALTTPDDANGGGTSWLWMLFSDQLCRRLFHELCRRNGVPLSGFVSLPDDLKVVILQKLTDGEDLARVECVSSQLRLLVAERDDELWKGLYKALPARQRWGRWRLWRFDHDAESSDEETLSVGSTWKNKYVEARWRPYPILFRARSSYLDSVDLDPMRIIRRRGLLSWPIDYWFVQDLPEEEETVPPRVDRSGASRRKLARNDYNKKPQGGGAIHSPSSRYRWKHR